jgi:hypothetical protein
MIFKYFKIVLSVTMATKLEEFQLPSIIFGRETKGRLPLVVGGVSFKYGNGVTVQTF